MPKPIQLLIAEDNPADAELLIRALRKADFEPVWKRVDTEADFLAALHAGLDLVLSDYDMPRFTGLQALELTKARHPEIPFIIVSGTIGEETAVATMRLGATDYLLKDRLTRLGPAVSQALEQGRLRRERQRKDEELREAYAQLNHLVARSPTVIYSLKLTAGGPVPTYVSINVTALSGFTVEEALRPEWWRDCVHQEDRASVQAGWLAAKEASVNRMEFRMQHADGSYLWVENRMRLLSDGNGETRVIVGGWTDITTRREAEEASRSSEERFRQLAENIDEVFWITDVGKNQMIYISPAYERIWGRTCDSLYASPQNWLEAIHPDDRGALVQAVQAQQRAGSYDKTFRIIRPDGALRWIRDRAFPVKEPDGRMRRIVGVAEDITEKKKLEEQFLHAQRLEAVGTLASGVAHDLNNILAPILMVAGLLKTRETASAKDQEMLGMVERSAQRGANIIRQLLTFSRSIPGERGVLQARHLLHEMLGIMQETFPRNIAIADSIPSDLWTVQADPTQLHQVLMNLCVNARDAMPAGGTLTLEAVNVMMGAPGVPSIDPMAKPGPYVLLRVRDTGQGIPPGVINRIFEPFFTTKESGKGTGLGLSTVVGIVKGHDGIVKVASEPGQGTVFDVYLPASGEKTEAAPVLPVAASPVGHGEWILVVDDEAPIRDAACNLLEGQGYHVLLADSGEEAVKVFVGHQDSIQLVLTDIMMPGMDGLALIRSLQMLRPSVRVIATSGLDQNNNRSELAALGVEEILAKPFTPAGLLKAVSQGLTPRQ